MKFQVERGDLVPVAAWAARLIGRSMIPALSGVLLTAEDGVLRVRAGDGSSQEGETSVPAKVDASGSTLVPAKLFSMLVNKLPSKPVNFSLTDDRLKVRCGRSNFSLRTMVVDDYPASMSVSDEAASITLHGDQFRTLVDQVAPAASGDESRPVLTGVSIEIEGGVLSAAATDSFRLAVRRFDHSDSNSAATALVPASVLKDVAKRSNDVGAEEVTLLLEGNRVQFDFEGYRTTASLLEGAFPNWRALMPEEGDCESLLRVNRRALAEAIQRVSVVASQGANVPMSIDVDDDGSTTVSVAHDGDLATDDVPGSLQNGQGFRAAYNPSFVLQALNSTDAEKVDIEFRSEYKPAVMNPAPDDEGDVEDLRILIMPMRVAAT